MPDVLDQDVPDEREQVFGVGGPLLDRFAIEDHPSGEPWRCGEEAAKGHPVLPRRGSGGGNLFDGEVDASPLPTPPLLEPQDAIGDGVIEPLFARGVSGRVGWMQG